MLRVIAAGTAIVVAAGCVPQALKPPGYVSDDVRAAQGHSEVRPLVDGQTPPQPRNNEEGILFALARRVGLDHGAARAAVGCGLAREAREFLIVQERREQAMRDMRDRRRELMVMAAQASAGIYVRLDESGAAGCAVAREQARAAAREDPWRGLYGTPLYR